MIVTEGQETDAALYLVREGKLQVSGGSRDGTVEAGSAAAATVGFVLGFTRINCASARGSGALMTTRLIGIFSR